jgi:hypothetical protein
LPLLANVLALVTAIIMLLCLLIEKHGQHTGNEHEKGESTKTV